MKLATYLKRKSLTYREIARKLGLSHTTVHKYLSGDRTPSLKTALKIEQVTKGDVAVSSWKKNEQAKS